MNAREDHASIEIADARTQASAAAIADASKVFDDAVDLDRLRFVRMVGQLQAIRLEKNNATGRDKKLTDAIKDFLAKVEETELIDGELQVAAWTEVRPGAHVYDLVAMAGTVEDAALLLLSAAVTGCLRVDDAALVRFRKGNGASWADRLWEYRMPGDGTVALHVGTVEEMEKRNG